MADFHHDWMDGNDFLHEFASQTGTNSTPSDKNQSKKNDTFTKIDIGATKASAS